jgi:hypothetical protein
MIREQVRPSYDACKDPFRRDSYVSSVVRLAKAGGELADVIGRLRGNQPVPEARQRITVERIQRLSAERGEGGS